MTHTETRVYQRSLELIDASKAVLDVLPTGMGFLADQLRRASSSVVLNLAEGCGYSSLRQRAKYFAIARGSVLEVAGCADIAFRFGVIGKAQHAKMYDLCDHISAMLSKFR